MNKISFLKLVMLFLVIEQCQSAPFYSLSLMPSADTILAGKSITITATVKDSLGTEYPSYESSIRWTLSDFLHDGSLSATGKSATFTAMKAYHLDTIKAYLFVPPMTNLSANSIITILPNKGYQVHIEKDSIPVSLWNTDTTYTVLIANYASTLHLYAIERDTFGNYIGMARNSSWAPLRSGIISVTSPSGIKGQVDISAIDSGICPLAVMDSALVSDTVYVFITTRSQVSTLFPCGIKKGNNNNIREIYNLKGRKLDSRANCISGVYIAKEGYLCNRKVRVAGSLSK